MVLAREDPQRPFSFAPVEILKGNFDGKEIDLFLDSVARRSLASDARRKVILVQATQGGPWRNLGLASTQYETVVRRILLLAPGWQEAEGKDKRAEFFLRLFGHEDPLISEVAYLEMTRAPYRTIKRLSRLISPEQIGPMLRSRQYVNWRKLAILLLAHHGKAEDKNYIIESFQRAERFGTTTNLAVLAVASIELDAADTVASIETKYFQNPHRKRKELIEVVKAMSLHGSEGRTELRDQIVSSYGVLLENHPQMAAQVAADLLTWKRTEFTADLAKIEAANATLNEEGKITVRRYLYQAAHSATKERLDDASR